MQTILSYCSLRLKKFYVYLVNSTCCQVFTLKNQKGSLSFVDGCKHFWPVNSNVIKATWEVLTLLLQWVLFHFWCRGYHFSCLSHSFQLEEKNIFLQNKRPGLSLEHNCSIKLLYLMCGSSSKALTGWRLQERMPGLCVTKASVNLILILTEA